MTDVRSAGMMDFSGGTHLNRPSHAGMGEDVAMASVSIYPPDFGTDLGKVRALIPDVELQDYNAEGDPEYLFTDAHLGAYLSLYTAVPVSTARVKRAAADALVAVAVSEALISKVIKTEDLQTDGAKVANALLAAAAQLRAAAEADEDRAEDDGGFQIVDFQPMPQECLPVSFAGFPYATACVAMAGCGCGGSYDHGAGFGRWV